MPVPRVDVIIPVYNCENYIEKCLNSFKEAPKKTIRLVICDDASSDHSFDILEKWNYQNTLLQKNQKNSGNLKTINKLFATTAAEYIAFQDADDWSSPNRLDAQLLFLEQENLDFCFTNFVKVDGSGNKELFTRDFAENIFIDTTNCLALAESICFASIIMKRHIYEVVGGFDPFFNHIGGADLDWLYRTVLSGFKGAILNNPLYYYRNNPQSYTSTVSLDARKLISPNLAQYLFQERLKVKEPTFWPHKSVVNQFIAKELAKLGFHKKENLRQYIIQQINRGHFGSAIVLLPKYLTMLPLKWQDLKIVNFLRYSINSGRR